MKILKKIKVDITTIDNYCKKNITEIDYIKVDTRVRARCFKRNGKYYSRTKSFNSELELIIGFGYNKFFIFRL